MFEDLQIVINKNKFHKNVFTFEGHFTNERAMLGYVKNNFAALRWRKGYPQPLPTLLLARRFIQNFHAPKQPALYPRPGIGSMQYPYSSTYTKTRVSSKVSSTTSPGSTIITLSLTSSAPVLINFAQSSPVMWRNMHSGQGPSLRYIILPPIMGVWSRTSAC
mmetsp:Transcript_35793/g.73189  ORF Transcript_35793/g.73189 Transcript_35793/m.73189 type:complete len:162 (-) Transcript_35793:169-654(-)